MINVVISVRLWAKDWVNKSVCILCDNAAVVAVLTNGKTKDQYLGACARTIWLLLAKHNIDLTVKHIAGKENHKADILSRWFHYRDINDSLVRDLKTCDWLWVEHDWLYPDFTI